MEFYPDIVIIRVPTRSFKKFSVYFGPKDVSMRAFSPFPIYFVSGEKIYRCLSACIPAAHK